MTDSDLWLAVRAEAEAEASRQSHLASRLLSIILAHDNFPDALAAQLESKLGSEAMSGPVLCELFQDSLRSDPSIVSSAIDDIRATVKCDSACRGPMVPFLHYKGFHALQSYRIANSLWRRKEHILARYLQGRISEVFAVDIHPAAQLGRGLLLDHAIGIVIGETAVVEDEVTIYHNVTLGATGKSSGDRHPKVHANVMIGAGAKILGNIVIGKGARVGAGSIVLTDVPPDTTVVGVPARVVRDRGVSAGRVLLLARPESLAPQGDE